MQLNRHSRLIRWYLFVNYCRSEEEKQKALAEATNLCTFMQYLTFGTMSVVMFFVTVPFAWVITVLAMIVGLLFGLVPIGWNASAVLDGDNVIRVMFPAVAFQWERKLGIRIGTRTIFPNHVWGTALIALGVWVLARWEVVGWSRVGSEIPVAWYVDHGTVLAIILLAVANACYAKWRNTEGWRVACAWLRAKVDRVCPRIEFTE